MNDTSEFMRKKQREIWLAKSEVERFVLGAQMADDGKALLEQGILHSHPGDFKD